MALKDEPMSKIYVFRGRNVPSEILQKACCWYKNIIFPPYFQSLAATSWLKAAALLPLLLLLLLLLLDSLLPLLLPLCCWRTPAETPPGSKTAWP